MDFIPISLQKALTWYQTASYQHIFQAPKNLETTMNNWLASKGYDQNSECNGTQLRRNCNVLAITNYLFEE